jgi:hypothetical protein
MSEHLREAAARTAYWKDLKAKDIADMKQLYCHPSRRTAVEVPQYAQPVTKAQQSQPNTRTLALKPAAPADDLTTAEGMLSSLMREAALDDTPIANGDLPAADPMHARALAMYPKSYRDHLLRTDMRALIAHDTLELETGRSGVELLAPEMLPMLAFQNADSVIERAQKLDTATKTWHAACNSIRAGKDKGPMPCLADIYERMFGPLGAA